MNRDTRQDESGVDSMVDSSQVTNGGYKDDDDDYHHTGSNNNNDHDDDRYTNDNERHQKYTNGNDDVNSAGEIEQDGEIIQQEQSQSERHGSSNDRNSKSNMDESSSLALRPLFFGNLIPNYSTDQINNIFEHPYKIDSLPNKNELQPIPVDRIDIKRGYCFVFFKDATSMEDKRGIESFCVAINGM
jgi:hypothetical protein